VRKYCEHVSLGRMAEPEDLVGPLQFLGSDASRYVTGQEIRVDGGFTA
jgi:NAD(P)-dependent dehydrogenase (short-subunit alcohol dehydrogenase family)